MPSQTLLKLYSKLHSHSNHLIGGFCRFLALVQTIQKNQTLCFSSRSHFDNLYSVLGTNPTGPGLTLCKIHQFKLKRPLAQ